MVKKKAAQQQSQSTIEDLPLIQSKPRKIWVVRLWNQLSITWKWIVAVALLAIGVIGFIGILATNFSIFPDWFRNDFFSRILPSPTPTLLPTLTPEFVAAKQGEILVIVSEFERQGGQTVANKTMYEQLQASIQAAINNPQLNDLRIRMGRTIEVISSHEAAHALADKNNATIVIWGNIANTILITHYEITPRWGQTIDTPIERTDFEAQLSNSRSLLEQISYRFERAIDQTYVTKFTLAQLLYSSNQYEAALPLFEELLNQAQTESIAEKRAKGIAEAWFYAGYIYQIIQHNDIEAQNAYNESITLNPQLFLAYNNRGNTYYYEGNQDAAINDYSKAINLNPQFAGAYNNRGSVFSFQHKWADALSDYNQAIQINPRFATAYYNRGNIFSELDKLDAAIADYDQAIQINPQFVSAYNNRGLAYYREGKPDKSITVINQTINPQASPTYYNKDKQDKLNKAIEDFTRAMKYDRQLFDAYFNRGLAYADQGNLDMAIADYNLIAANYNVLAYKQRYIELYFYRGNIYFNKGNLAAAIGDYNTAIQLNPYYPDPYAGLGNVYYDQKQYTEALQSYQKYLELAGDNPSSFVVQRVQELETMLKTATPTN